MSPSTRDVFENLPVPRAILRNALPTMAGMLVVLLYNLADTFFVGQTGDPLQVAAVSLAMPVFLLFMATGNLIGIGGTSVISRSLGAKHPDYARKVSAFCFYTAIGVGLMFTLAFWLGMPWILHAIGTSSDTWQPTHDYLMHVAPAAPFVILSVTFSNIVRSEGYAKRSMIGMTIGTGVNIVLDPLLILGFHMGVTGAAIATLIGNIAGATYYLSLFLRGRSTLSIHWRDFQIGEGVMRNVLAIGIPVALNNMLMSASAILQNNYIARYGDVNVAAMGITMRLMMLVVLLQIALGAGILPLLGYSFGARNRQRFMSIMKVSMLYSLILGIGMTTLVALLNAQIIRAFIDEPTVVETARHFINVLLLSGPLIGLQFILRNALQAIGAARESLILSVSRQGVFFVPLLMILDPLFGLQGLIFAQPAADMLALLLALGLYLQHLKQIDSSNPFSGQPASSQPVHPQPDQAPEHEQS